jgi:D-galactarolactone isomerase
MDFGLTMRPAPRLHAPAGAWDSHIHILDPRFPTVADAVYQPPVATVEDYRAVQCRLGLQRVLVIQSSTHGTDHTCLLDAIAQFGAGARGVGMVKAEVNAAELLRLTEGGVRGARCLMTPGGVLSWQDVPRLATRIQEFGWHTNLQMRGNTLPERFETIAALPGKVVIDHMGLFSRPVAPDHPEVRTLLRLLDTGRVWVKLSAPYGGGIMGPPPFTAAWPLARALVRHAPERLVWGSDWPNTFMTQVYKLPPGDPALLLDLLLEWADDDATRHRILVDNPEALFGA